VFTKRPLHRFNFINESYSRRWPYRWGGSLKVECGLSSCKSRVRQKGETEKGESEELSLKDRVWKKASLKGRVVNVESERSSLKKSTPTVEFEKGEYEKDESEKDESERSSLKKASLEEGEIGRVNEKKPVCGLPCVKRKNDNNPKEDIILRISKTGYIMQKYSQQHSTYRPIRKQ